MTGGFALAKATGAAYHVNADDPVGFARVPVHDGDTIAVGDTMRMRVLATPGHTFTHLAYLPEADAAPIGAFTGGSLLYGSTGRPDLLGPGNTATLVRLQFASARRLAAELPDITPVFPTHGFGSFATYLGWLLPWGMPLSLLGEAPDQVAEAQRELARIGIDRPVAAAARPPQLWSDGAPLIGLCLASLRELAAARGSGVVVLDVRRRLEWSEGHLAGAVHIPLHELPRRLGEVPAGQVWVVCRSGYRATIAASLLAASGGRRVSTALTAGLPAYVGDGGSVHRPAPLAGLPSSEAGSLRGAR